MAGVRGRRNGGDRDSLPFYELTAQLATLEPLPPEIERVLERVHGDQDEMDAFARVGGAVTSPPSSSPRWMQAA